MDVCVSNTEFNFVCKLCLVNYQDLKKKLSGLPFVITGRSTFSAGRALGEPTDFTPSGLSWQVNTKSQMRNG